MSDAYRSPAERGREPWERPRRRYFVIGAGVILPIVAVAFELGTGACSELLFDPLPTPLHVALVLLVPLANGLVSWRRTLAYPRLLWGLTGASLAVSAVYAAAFVPIMPIALLALIYYGLGALPLSPALAVIASLLGRGLLERRTAFAPVARRGPTWIGAGAASLLLLLPAAGELVVDAAVARAASTDPAEARAGREFLRAYVPEARLLDECGGRRSRRQPLLLGFLQRERPDPARVAEAFYRVTGRLCAPADFGFGRDRFAFDGERPLAVAHDPLGPTEATSDVVLVASRIDGSVDATAAVGYLEWTLSFENEASWQREARAIVELPKDGVVSRATLWVAGEPREAAFAGRAEVTQAYERVVNTRKDPLLVTSAGPDRVEIRCFPVVQGSEMKIRVGVTAPLSEGRLALPRLVQRSFAVRGDHRIWIEGDTAFRWGDVRSGPAGSGHRLERTLPAAAWQGVELTFDAPPGAGLAWAEDPADAGFAIVQRIQPRTAPAPARVVLVVDGSLDLAPLRAALQDFPPGVEIAAVAAGDEPIELLSPAPAEPAALRRLAIALGALQIRGGPDNAAALVRGLELGKDGKSTAVLWLHGPVPYVAAHPERAGQLLERSPELELTAFQLAPGPDRMGQALESAPRFRGASVAGSLEATLRRQFRSWSGAPLPRATRTREARDPALPPGGKQTSKHLVRLWARDEIERLAAAEQRGEAIRLAGVHQLVTSVSGAVVLETRQQFADAGLTPAAPDSVPSVPEPGFWIVVGATLLFGAALLLRQRQVAPCP